MKAITVRGHRVRGAVLALVWGLVSQETYVPAQTPFEPAPLVPPPPAANSPASLPVDPAPRIQFATPIHDFGRVVSGAVLRHDFYFTNVGSVPLEISNVQVSCGCTTAGEWSRRVEPGQTGMIPIQFATAGFQGMVFKTITIHCNDPQQPNVTLQLRANLWNPIEVNPRYATLRANPERFSQARAVVQILNHEEAPLQLKTPVSSNPLLQAEVLERVPGREFELILTPTGQAPPGPTQATISIPTSSTNVPVLNLTAIVILDPVVTVSPPFIQLAPGPLPAPQTVEVHVMNQGTNRLELSEVSVSNTNVTAEVQETAPGQYFLVRLHFPAGFLLAPGQVAALSARTSHPQYPALRVPIAQARSQVSPAQVLRPASPPQPIQAPPAPPPAVGPVAPGRPARPPTEFPPLPGG